MPSRVWFSHDNDGNWSMVEGVLVEDGREGEPTAEEALRIAMGALRALNAGSSALAVLRRSIESEDTR
jgi:hypothetical protein